MFPCNCGVEKDLLRHYRASDSKPIFEGYIWKQSIWIKKWNKRYFSLYFEPSHGGALCVSTAKGVAPYKKFRLLEDQIDSVKSAEEITDCRFAFQLRLEGELLLLRANSDEEKNNWLSEIGKAMTSRDSDAFGFDGDDDYEYE